MVKDKRANKCTYINQHDSVQVQYIYKRCVHTDLAPDPHLADPLLNYCVWVFCDDY